MGEEKPLRRNHPLCGEEEVESAITFLRDHAKEMGEARRQQILTEKRRAHVEALEMKKHATLPVSAQQREARASQAYLECIEAEAYAAGEFERLKALREAASAIIEVFRTESANYRGIRL
jgi:uncharacterized protein YpiB (UPF0302 family)